VYNVLNLDCVLKIDLTERGNDENKRSIKNNRLIHENFKDAGPELQPAGVGLSNWIEA